MIKKTLLLVTLACTNVGYSQRNFTIEEATAPYLKFRTERIVAPQWKNKENITHLSKDYQSLMVTNTSRSYKDTLVTKATLENLLKDEIKEDTFSLQIFPYQYKWINENIIQFEVNGNDLDKKYVVQLNLKNNRIEKYISFPKAAEQQEVTKDLSYVVWLKENNLMITYANGTTKEITSDKDIINGNSNVHRNEFGIHKGFWISPKLDKIMFYSKDETMVSDYPLINFGQRVAENKMIKYPMAGMTSEQVKLKVYNLKSNKTITLQTSGDKEQFLTMPTFTPNGKDILVGVLNRKQNHLKVQLFDAKKGLFKRTLFTQTDKTYVEPSHDFKFLPNKENEFLYVTDRDGYRNMERYNLKGKKLKTYQYKDVVFKEYVGIDSKYIYYMGATNQGMDQLLFKTRIKTGKTKQLSNELGIHKVKHNNDFSLFYDEFNNARTANKVEIINHKGADVSKWLTVATPYEEINMPKVEYVELKSADGQTNLNGRLTYPVSFDNSKKYPVMIYVYGGPHAQLVTNSFGYGAGGFDYYMAQQGYVVFTLDNRGSENRGKDFEQIIHRNLGQNEMKDQMKGVEFLKSKSFVDTDKIGVYGWSFGGFMTTSLMTTYPETFKVGVAGGPVIDWKWYEIMYGERYMDMPDENPEGYAKTSLLDKVENLKGRLLMIHGAQDPVVLQQHSMEFLRACISKNVLVDYFLYPTHEHNVRGKDRVHLNSKIADYFNTHLK